MPKANPTPAPLTSQADGAVPGPNLPVALLEQQTTLSFIQQTACIATWELNLVTNAITFGHGSYPVFGRPCSEIRFLEDLRRFVHPEDLGKIDNSIRNSIDSDSMTQADYRIILPSGELRWLEGRRLPILNEDGVATHLRNMTTDITDRKRNEEMLTASEARYRVLAELNPQALWMGAPDGSIIYANQGFLDYIGKTIDDIAGLGWLDAFDPIDRQQVVAAWTKSIATGQEYAIEARLLRASDKSSRWWALRGLPVRDESGVILHWLGVANDIHDVRINAEMLFKRQEETERQRAELQAIYDTAPIGLALFDPIEFRYLRLNDRQAAFFGIPASEILGKTLTEMAPIAGLQEMFEEVARGNPIINHLLEGKLATDAPGVHRYWAVNYLPVFNSEGAVEAISAASFEVTHQKKSELALIQSEKLAAVGRLASSISHEINNPLEAITNLLFLIALDDELPESIKGYVHMAQSELGRVSQIVTQTLRFHRQAVKQTSVSAGELVDAVLNLYQGRLANSGIHVRAKYTSQTRILCFENDIRQVLNNLIANAIDAMRGGGHLLVRAHDATHIDAATGQPCKGVRITIADTGHGMSHEVRDRIFEPFYTTKDLNGTGLGLWISAGIVAHHKGHLTLRSTDSPQYHGTIFSLFLPIQPS